MRFSPVEGLAAYTETEGAQVQLAILRQRVAEWRDLQIVTAAALLNRKAIEAGEAFEAHIEKATSLDSIFNAAALANARIDALMRAAVAPELEELMAMAGKELASIDLRLKDLADAFERTDAIELPGADEADSPLLEPGLTPIEASPEMAQAPDEDSRTRVQRLAQLPGRVAKGAASLAGNATTAADGLFQDTLGLKNRLRAAATQRISDQWMGDVGEPRPVLAQLIALIDDTTYAARTRLS